MLTLWIDYKDPALKDVPEFVRYALELNDNFIFFSDHFDETIAYIKEHYS